MRNPQLNAEGELTHLLTLEGLPAEVIVRILDTAVPFASIAERDVKKVPLLRGTVGVQPVLRELDAHAHDVRDRRQAAVGRRDQPQHRRVVDEQGRDAARHRRQPGRDERRHVRRPPCAVGRAAPDRRASQPDRPRARPRRQRRRRPPRAPDAGAARPVHDPALQAGFPQADGRHRRRRAALARRALADPRPDDARHAGGARDRPEDAAADRACRRWACRSTTTCARASRAATSS